MKIIKGKEDAFNRQVLERKQCDILVIPLVERSSDKLKQMDSGINEVIARIAAKNNIAIGLDVREIQSINKKEKAQVLARMIQTIKICRKTKTALAVNVSKDAGPFLISLGASTQQVKHAITQSF